MGKHKTERQKHTNKSKLFLFSSCLKATRKEGTFTPPVHSFVMLEIEPEALHVPSLAPLHLCCIYLMGCYGLLWYKLFSLKL